MTHKFSRRDTFGMFVGALGMTLVPFLAKADDKEEEGRKKPKKEKRHRKDKEKKHHGKDKDRATKRRDTEEGRAEKRKNN